MCGTHTQVPESTKLLILAWPKESFPTATGIALSTSGEVRVTAYVIDQETRVMLLATHSPGWTNETPSSFIP